MAFNKLKTYDKEVVFCFGMSFNLNAWSDPAALRRPDEIGWENNEQRKIEPRFLYDLEMKTRKQNRNNKRTEIERFDCFIEHIQTRVAFGWLSEHSGEKTSCQGTF